MDKYRIHDVVPSKDPEKLTVTVVMWDTRAPDKKVSRVFDVDGTSDKPTILSVIDRMVSAQRVDYLQFKSERTQERDIT